MRCFTCRMLGCELTGEFWIAPHEWFVLYSDGELLSVPGPLNRRGVTFDSVVVLRYGDERLCHVHIELLAAADLEVGLSLAVQNSLELVVRLPSY
jgi:hypothetical protein